MTPRSGDAHDLLPGADAAVARDARAVDAHEPHVESPIASVSYAASWAHYINGNVFSEMSREYILNMLATTTTPLMEAPGDSSDSSEGEETDQSTLQVGSMNTVTRTLDGVRDSEEGTTGFGRYSSSIRLGRNLWQSASLAEEVKQAICETTFKDGQFPDREKNEESVEKIARAG